MPANLHYSGRLGLRRNRRQHGEQTRRRLHRQRLHHPVSHPLVAGGARRRRPRHLEPEPRARRRGGGAGAIAARRRRRGRSTRSRRWSPTRRSTAIWICGPNFARVENMERIVDARWRRARSSWASRARSRSAATPPRRGGWWRWSSRRGVLHGYLENQLFRPGLERGKEIIWARGAAASGRPYLARAAEEHGGPHMPWFWRGDLQGGGVLNDMMCHSLEVGRYLLTAPGAPRASIRPVEGVRADRVAQVVAPGIRRAAEGDDERARSTTRAARPRTSRAPASTIRTSTASRSSSKRPRRGASSAPGCG